MLKEKIVILKSVPVGIPSCFEPLPKPFTTVPSRYIGKLRTFSIPLAITILKATNKINNYRRKSSFSNFLLSFRLRQQTNLQCRHLKIRK